MTRVVVADDEPHLRHHLLALLVELWPGHGPGRLELCGEAADGEEALALIRRTQPELAFLDIRMPALTGLDVARRVAADAPAGPPLLVFVTAYDDHAVEAFEAAAVDYLLKPVARARLAACLERIADRLGPALAPAPDEDARLRDLLARLDRLDAAASKPPLRWLRAAHGEETELVPVDDVVYFKAGDKYVSAFTGEREHVLRMPLKELLRRLDGERFWQVHRGVIVNVGQIERARRDLRGRYVLTLRDRREKLRTSLAFAHLFRSM